MEIRVALDRAPDQEPRYLWITEKLEVSVWSDGGGVRARYKETLASK